MIVKDKWTNDDLEDMDWHDCTLYSITFPVENQVLKFDIDYIFSWVLDEKSNLYEFYLSPCSLFFFDVLHLSIQIDFKDSVGIFINEMKRKELRLSPDGRTTIYEYSIETDQGILSFESTCFEQIVLQQPVLSKSLSLGR